MTTLNHWLIALDLSETDQEILRYAALLSKLLIPEEITFLYVTPKSQIPSVLRKELPGLHEPDLNLRKAELAAKVGQFFYNEIPISCEVKEGESLSEILKACRKKSIDLLIVGKKEEAAGSGTLARKLVRKAPCSVVFVPESAPSTISNIFLPIDFSSYSKLALERARNFASRLPSCTIFCQHVYNSADWYINETYLNAFEVKEQLARQQELNEKLESYYHQKMQDFVKEVDLAGVQVATILSQNRRATQSISKRVLDAATNHKADFLIMGSHGQSVSPSLLVGKVSEKVGRLNYRIPMMILKKKGENQSLLKALLG